MAVIKRSLFLYDIQYHTTLYLSWVTYIIKSKKFIDTVDFFLIQYCMLHAEKDTLFHNNGIYAINFFSIRYITI